jgi:biotin carboxyl carrier protein
MAERPSESSGSRLQPSVADALGELLRLVERSDVEELDVQYEETRFRIRRDLSGQRPTARIETDRPAPPPEPEGYVVTSPVVGIYRRPSGTASEPVLVEGEEVAAGQVVGAVEAMRMLNRVQSERAGIVLDVLVRDGQPVEYGQPLLVLREP